MTRFLGEAIILACLLMTNVVMGGFTHSSLQEFPNLTAVDRIQNAFTVQNIFIALSAGLILSLIHI